MNDTATATEAAPAAPATPIAAQPSWSDSVATAFDGASPAPGTPGAAAPAPAADPWEAELPKPVIRSAAERIAAKQAAAVERARFVPVEQQLQAERARVAQLTQTQAEAESKFKRLLDAGDIDGALEVKGFGKSFFELQRQMLQAKGALPPPDPRYDKLSAELAEYKQKEAANARQQAEAQARAQAAAQWQADVAEVQAEVAQLPFAGAKEFAAAPGVNEAVTRALVDNPGLTTAQAAAIVRQDYLALYKALSTTFGAQPASQAESFPGSGVRATPTAIPVNGGAAPVLDPPSNMSPDELFRELAKQHGFG